MFHRCLARALGYAPWIAVFAGVAACSSSNAPVPSGASGYPTAAQGGASPSGGTAGAPAASVAGSASGGAAQAGMTSATGANTGGAAESGGAAPGGSRGTSPAAGGASPAAGGAGAGGTANFNYPPLTAIVTLHVAGDSTAAIFPTTDATHRVGWASVLQPYFSAGVKVNDAARSGRSSKSFIDEGFWTSLKASIHSGDYVFIEFGHNDEKVEDSTLYTDPATTFRTYLKTYISDTRAAGGFAVLLTPISRRKFVGDKISATHGAYPAAVIAVGKETNTPVIDMTEKTRVFLESLGPTDTIPLFAMDDNTHLSAQGAPKIAELAVRGIRELGMPIAERLSP